MGQVEIESNKDEIIALFKRAIPFALQKVGLVAERYAVEYEDKVDTGRLKGSITHATYIGDDEKAVYIGTNVEYAQYVEFGTYKMQAANGGKGFLRPTATNHMDEYRQIIYDELVDA